VRSAGADVVSGKLEDARPAGDHALCAEITLAPVPSAAGLARRFTEAFLRKHDLGAIAEAACLITSELVTNAIKATGATRAPADPGEITPPAVVARLRVSARVLRIEIWDNDPRLPVPAMPAALDEGGRGLMLVAALATAWGHHPSASGKAVWAEVPIHLETTCNVLSSPA
jgi:anti-sigma regulatory factor (Ser/Thr protein kinase)